MSRKGKMLAIVCLLLLCTFPLFSSDSATLVLRGIVPRPHRPPAWSPSVRPYAAWQEGRCRYVAFRVGGTVNVFVRSF
jgi:hypothetical protein